MKTCHILLSCLMAIISNVAYAQSMDSVLVRVPQSELPLLERNPRLDMLDLFNSNMEAKAENAFGGNSYLLEKDKNHLFIRLTDVSDWEVQRLTLQEDTIFACIHTVRTPAAGSTIRYYTGNWEPDTSYQTIAPEFSAFWQAGNDSLSAARKEELQRIARHCPISIRWEKESGQAALSFQVFTAALAIEDQEDIKKCLRNITGPAEQFIRKRTK